MFYGKACGFYYAFLFIGIALMLPCFCIAFPILIGNNYADAYGTIPLFLVMAVLSACSTFVGNIFYAIKDTRSLFTSMLISCVCNLLLCGPLINSFGINGANLSISISFLLNIVIRYIILHKKIQIKHNIAYYILPSCIVALGTVVYLTGNMWLNIESLIILCVCILVVLIKIKHKTQLTRE